MPKAKQEAKPTVCPHCGQWLVLGYGATFSVKGATVYPIIAHQYPTCAKCQSQLHVIHRMTRSGGYSVTVGAVG